MLKSLLLLTIVYANSFGYEIVIDKTEDKLNVKMEKQSTIVRDAKREIITDISTGLMWEDNNKAKVITADYKSAQVYCKYIETGGLSGWRLPNIRELESISDYARYNPATKRGFVNESSKVYWSSTGYISDSKFAWGVDFKNGRSSYYRKTTEYNVRCVRTQ